MKVGLLAASGDFCPKLTRQSVIAAAALGGKADAEWNAHRGS